MKIAITDACIFIDLIEIRLTSGFFGFSIEIHTSLDVFNELYPEQKELLKAYMSIGKLVIHNITGEEKMQIKDSGFPRSLSEIDMSVIFLAEKFDAMLLSSDKAVRNYAKSRTIEYHGMLWIFDRLIESGLISGKEAIEKIRHLLSTNIIYRDSYEMNDEIEKRIEKWKCL
jgi:predicted nucleic acid-binding protein